MIETTKVQEIGVTNNTTIPKIYCKILDIQKGDTLKWNIDLNKKVLYIQKLE